MKHVKLRSFTFVLVVFMSRCNEFVVMGALSDITRSYRVPLPTVGFLVTAFAGAYTISTPITTTLTSDWNRYNLLMLLMTVSFIGNALTAMAPMLGWLLLARTITAAVTGTTTSLISLLVSTVIPIDERPMVLAWVSVGFSVTPVIEVPLGITIAALLSWHNNFWIISGLTLTVFALLVWLTPRGTPQIEGSILEQLALLKDRRVLLGIGIMMAVLSLQYTFYIYVRLLVTTVMDFSLTSLNRLLLLLGAMSITGSEITGIVASRDGVQKLPFVFILMTTLNLVLGIALRDRITGILVLATLCVIAVIYGVTTQLVFISMAEKECPQSLALATLLISIFASVEISFGSSTAPTTANFADLMILGYVGAVYGLLTIGLSFALCCSYRK